jgi:hypothetical protein
MPRKDTKSGQMIEQKQPGAASREWSRKRDVSGLSVRR